MKSLSTLKHILSISLLILLTACGGGGGGGGGTRNLPPTVSNNSPDTVDERSEATLSVIASDPDGSIREYRWIQTGGPRVTFSNGRDFITFDVPEVQQNETMSFSIDVVDDFGAITSLDIGVNIRNINRAPVADAQQLTVEENSSIEFNLTATDPDGDTLTYSITAQPTVGSLELVDGATQLYRYTPNQDSVVDDQITFSATDAELSDTATISFDVVAAVPKSLRITAFSAATTWDDPRWVELTNTGTDSINLKTYELRTQQLSATQFKPENDYYVALPDQVLKTGEAITLLLTGTITDYSVIETNSIIHQVKINNSQDSRPFWNRTGFIEVFNGEYLSTDDFVRFGLSTNEPIRQSAPITTLQFPLGAINFMQIDATLTNWFAKN